MKKYIKPEVEVIKTDLINSIAAAISDGGTTATVPTPNSGEDTETYDPNVGGLSKGNGGWEW